MSESTIRDDERLRQAMRGYAARMAATHAAPPAGMVWLRAERRRRRLAVERAERPLRVMQVVGLVFAALAACWALVRMSPAVQRPTVGAAMIGLAVTTAVLVAGGCWAMVAASRG
jgi:hypothetical protein